MTEQLETRTLLAADLSLLGQGLNDTFGGLQESLNSQVFGTDIPLVGDGLQDENSAGQIFTRLQNDLGNSFQNVETVDQAQAAITAAFGSELSGTITTTGSDGDAEVTFGVAFTPSITGTLPFDLGLDSVGLSLAGSVSVTVAATLNLEFGVNENDFFVSTGGANSEFQFSVTVGIPNFNATGTFGDFLQIQATDNAETPSSFAATYDVDVVTPNGRLESFSNVEFVSSLTGTADLNLDIEASIPGTEIAPKLLAEFNVDWAFDAANPEGDAAVFGNRPRVAFDNIRLDMNSFFQKFAEPVVTRVQNVLRPIQPLVSVLTTPVPLLTEINKVVEPDIGPTLADLIGNQSITNFATAVRNVLDISVPDVNFEVPLGSFALVDPRGGTARAIDEMSMMTEADPLATARTMGGSSVSVFFDRIQGSIAGPGLEFPLLQNPLEAFQLLIGETATLFTWDMPAISGMWELNRFVPVFGPLGVNFGGALAFSADFAFGYDTTGIRQFRTGGSTDFAKILNGFYVSDRAMADGSGDDVDEVSISGRIEASAALDAGFLSAQAGGGFTADIALNLNDPDGDGRVRADELLQNASLGAINIFDLSGALTADVFLRGEVAIKVGRFRIGETFEYPHKFEPLIYYERIGGPQAEPGVPTLASQSGGTLTLHAGPLAGQRERHDVTDGDETFLVRPAIDATGATIPGSVIVAAFGFEQQFDGVSQITGNGGSGDDRIVIERDIVATASLLGGNGNDTLQYSGSGNATLRGGTGNDRLVGGSGENMLFGDENNDSLTGGDMRDTIDGGTGNDRLFGLGDIDSVTGGDGDDFADGGAGDDVVSGGAGSDELKGGAGNDSVSGEAGDDRLFGGDDDDTLLGAAGNDTLSGDDGVDSLLGGANDDVLGGGAGDDVLNGDGGADTLDGQAGDDIVDGGADDDLLLAISVTNFRTGVVTPNGGDQLIGGDGNDRIDARQATETVSIVAGPGNDRAWGGSASDQISGGTGEDTLSGGAGDDTITGNEDADTIFGDAGNDQLNGSAVSTGQTKGEVISGGDDDDTITGDVLHDSLRGDGGNDLIQGLAGNDTILGGSGDDMLFGGAGNDDIVDSLNAFELILAGGRPGDTDVIDAGTGDDIVTAFGPDTITAGPESLPGGSEDSTDNDIVNAGKNSAAGILTVMLGAGDDIFRTFGVATFGNSHASVSGGSGDDILLAEGDTTATLRGGSGNDILDARGHVFGEADADIFLGNSPVDTDQDVDVQLTLREVADPVERGENAEYDLTVTASGTDFTIDPTIEFATSGTAGSNGTATLPVGVPRPIGGTTMLGDRRLLAPGVSETIVQRVLTSTGGTLDVTATVSHSGPDSNSANDSAFETTSIVTFTGDSAVNFDGSTLNVTATNGGNINVGITFVFDPRSGQNKEGVSVNGETQFTGAMLGFDIDNDGEIQTDEMFPVPHLAADVTTVTLTGDEFPNTISMTWFDSVSMPATTIRGLGGGDTITAPAIPSTIEGGAGSDTITGSSIGDTIDGGPDHDLIRGGGGDDSITGGTGNDVLQGEAGSDTLDGQAGDDNLNGGDGADSVHGGAGRDIVLGGSDDSNTLDGGDGDDFVSGVGHLNGGDGDDRLDASTFGTPRLSTLLGGVGDDSLTGSNHSESLDGGDGDDTIRGQDGDDTLVGGDGHDLLEGGTGADSVSGDAGRDTLNGGGGSDTLDGGADDDLLDDGSRSINSMAGEVDVADGGAGEDRLFHREQLPDSGAMTVDVTLTGTHVTSSHGRTDFLGIEFVEINSDLGGTIDASAFAGSTRLVGGLNLSGPSTSTILGGSGADLIENAGLASGGAGDDTIIGSEYSDTLRGDAGNDQIFGNGDRANDAGTGGDLLDGGEGSDRLSTYRPDNTSLLPGMTTLLGGAGDDTLEGNHGSQFLDGQDGDDVLLAGDGDDIVMPTGGGFDEVSGGAGSDLIDASGATAGLTIDGGPDRDTITGSPFDDILFGHRPNEAGQSGDSIDGGAGDDEIESEVGLNTLRGGAGDDVIRGRGELFGEAGSDNIRFGSIATVWGGDGDDLIEPAFEFGSAVAFGEAGDDTLIGGRLSDTLSGGEGDDELLAGDGEDLIVFEEGNDILDGGDPGGTAGRDVLQFGGEITRLGNTLLDLPDGGRFKVTNTQGENLETGQVVAISGIDRLLFVGSEGDDFFDYSEFPVFDPADIGFIPSLSIIVDTLGGDDEVVASPYPAQVLTGAGDDLLRIVDLGGPLPNVAVNIAGGFQDFVLDGPDGRGFLEWRDLERVHITGTDDANGVDLRQFPGDATVVSGGGDDTLTSSLSDTEIDSGPGNDTIFLANEPGETASYRVRDASGDDTLDFSLLQQGLENLDLDVTGTLLPLTLETSLLLEGRFEHVVGTAQADTLSLTMLPETTQSFLAGMPGDEAMSGDSLTVRVPPPVTFGDVSVSETAVTAPGLAAVTLASVEDVTIAALPDPTTRVEIGSDGSLIISDIAASGGKADQLFIAGSPGADGLLGTADDQVIVRDTGAQFENLTPNGISNGLHEISIPVSDVSGGLIVNVADDDDSVVLTDLPFSATVSGGAGADSLDGSQAEMPVELDGGTGNDLLAGSSANDRLVDGPGDDHLSGGGGYDEFVLTPGSDDVVTDSGGSDVLNFSLAAAGITLDLDAVGIPQAVDASGNTVQLEGEFEGFVGSVFDDEVSTRAIDRLRRIAGGGFSSAGDRLIVDAQSRAAGDDGLRVAVSGQAAIEYQGSVQNVTVNNALNEAPVARFDDATTRLGQPVTIGVLGNDSDFNGDALTVDSVTTPANGAASINPDGTIEYTPEDGFAGADTFSYEISDSSGATSTASVTVTVTEPPRVTLPDAGGDFEITAENGRVVVRDGSGSEVGNAQLTAGDSLLINGASGDDSLTLDLSVLSGLNIDRVVFDGLAGFDTLTVTGGSFGAATIDLTNPTDGRIQLDGTTIDFRGLEPVDLTGTTATDVVLNLPDGGVRAVLEPFAAGQLRLRSTDPLPAFEETIFAIPSGNVTVNGGDGDDLIDASGAGIGLVVNGAGGSDVLIGSSLADTLSGNAGADRIEAGAGDDVLLGGTENDTLIGNSGDDDLRGEAGDDVLSGGAGSDVLVGSDGDDWLRGQGASGDVLSGGLGNDHLDGGAGTDRLIESGNVSFTATDHSLTGLGDDLMAGIEFLRLTGGVSDNSIDAGAFSGNVVLNGRGGDDLLIGGAGNDNINGGAGRDTLVGNAGNDRLRGQGSTGDKISGGLGDDTLDGGAGNDQLIETGDADFELSDSALTGLGNDLVIGIERAVLRGGGSDNRIDASSFSGAVALLGFGGADTLLGGASNDRLRGAAGRDLLIGGPGNDALFGQGSSGDTLEGGPGADLLDGGSGGDRLISDELDTVINDALDVILGP